MPSREKVASGWEGVAAAKNEVFQGDQGADHPGYSAKPATQQNNTFDFNSYGQPPAQQQASRPTHTTSSAGGGSFMQQKAGIRFNGFQRQQQPGSQNRQAYDSYGGDLDPPVKQAQTLNSGQS